ncbi:MAG: FtsX-like permease family protein [Myxococcota bacterium]
MSRGLRIGWPAGVLAALVVAHIGVLLALAGVLSQVLRSLALQVPWPIGDGFAPGPLAWLTIALAATAGGLLVVAPVVLVRARRLQPGAEGRMRWIVLALAAVGHVATAAPTLGIGRMAVRRVIDTGFGMVHPSQLLMALPGGLELVLAVLAALALAGAAVAAVTLGTCWFLLPERPRRVAFSILDAVLLAGTVWATISLPIAPSADAPDATTGPAMRLVLTALFAVRLSLRLLPYVLALVERSGFRSLIAARHLRARKSSFLAAIGMLSILAVGFSSCSLTTTLSVMGGFRQDLKNKILGNHAHVVVDREHSTFEGWSGTLERIRGVEGVRAAAPYVSGEVMVSSASNLGGAVLRGVVPGEVGNVLDLEKNIVCPESGARALDYLQNPERLLDLPSEDRRCGELPLEVSMREVEASGSEPEALEGTGIAGQLPTLEEGPSPSPEATEARDAASPRPSERSEPEATNASPEARQRRPAGERAEGGPPHPSERSDPEVERSEASRGARGRSLEEGEPSEKARGAAASGPARGERVGGSDENKDILPGIIVGQELARTLRLYVGDEVNVVSPFGDLGPTGPMPKSRPFRVAGIFYSGMYEYDMKYAYTTLPVAQRFLGVGDAISGIEGTVDDIEDAPAVAARVRQAVGRPELRVQDWQELNKNLFGALALEKLAMFVTLGIAVLVAGFCVFGTLTLMVQEKGREVGILKAMGTSRRLVIGIFLVEGLLIGLFGAALGLGLGFLVGFVAKHFQVVPINPEVYYIDKLPVHMDPLDFGLVGLAAVLVCLLATVFPAILASRLRPVEALRYD